MKPLHFFGRPIWDWLRACAACGRAWGATDFFCSGCWRDFKALANRGARLRQAQEDIPVYALWTWSEANDPYIRPLVYALKGGWPAGPVEKLVEDLSLARASLPLRPRDFAVVLPPRRKGRENDHGFVLASEFARFWRAPLLDVLQLAGPEVQSQKHKSAVQRSELRYGINDKKAIFGAGAPPAWVFIDDVVTTGATARAAHLALGSPNQFEVWALASRPPSAEIATQRGLWYAPPR